MNACAFINTATEQQIPVDQAFQLTVNFQNTNSIIAHWNMPNGYLLYQNRIKIKTSPQSSATIGTPFIPPNDTLKQASVNGEAVFENYANAYIPIQSRGYGLLKLLIHYQGCKGENYCYPPVNKLAIINLNTGQIAIKDAPEKHTASIGSDNASHITNILRHKNDFWVILSFFGFGLLLAFTPCVLPMLPILFGIIVGQNPKGHAKHTFILSSLYVLSMAITFAIAGVIAASIGKSLQAFFQNPIIIVGFSLIFVLLALSLFGVFELQLPAFIRDRLFKTNQDQKPGSYWGAVIMGGLSTLIVSPCVTPPLIGALIYIADTGNVTLGGIALFALGLGMGVPFIILALLGTKAIPKAGMWMNTIKPIFGFIMLGIAIWLLGRAFSGPVALFLFGALFIGAAIFGGLFRSSKTPLRHVWRIITLLFFIYGVILIIGAASGNDSLITPLESASHHRVTFIQVKTPQELQTQLNLAKKHHQKVVLDFYADWCTACQEMEATTFTNPMVIEHLKNYRRLQVNLTHNDKGVWAIAKQFKVYAPPSLVFYNSNGELMPSAQIFGKVSATTLLFHLKNQNMEE